jgi:hypothetical protein
VNIQVGSKIRISMQLHDGKANKIVYADIISVFGEQLARIQLSHVSGGLYLSQDGFEMPDVEIVAQYHVADSEDYEVVSESYRPVPRPKSEPKFLIGEVTSRVKSSEYIEGIIYEA